MFHIVVLLYFPSSKNSFAGLFAAPANKWANTPQGPSGFDAAWPFVPTVSSRERRRLVFMYLQVFAHLRLRRTWSTGVNRSVRQTVYRNNWSVSRGWEQTDMCGTAGGIYLRFWTASTIHYSSLKSSSTKSSRIYSTLANSGDLMTVLYMRDVFSTEGLSEDRSWNESSRISPLQMIRW